MWIHFKHSFNFNVWFFSAAGPPEEEDGIGTAPAAVEVETAQEPKEPESKTGARAKHKQPIKTTVAAAKHSGKTSFTKRPAKKRR